MVECRLDLMSCRRHRQFVWSYLRRKQATQVDLAFFCVKWGEYKPLKFKIVAQSRKTPAATRVRPKT